MKRFTVIALALVMSFSMLTACGTSEEEVKYESTDGSGAEVPPDTDGDSGDIDEVPPEYREENGTQEEE